jgi:hypothetical protein
MSTSEPGLHHRTDTFVLGLAVRSLDCHPEPLGGRRKRLCLLFGPIARADTRCRVREMTEGFPAEHKGMGVRLAGEGTSEASGS